MNIICTLLQSHFRISFCFGLIDLGVKTSRHGGSGSREHQRSGQTIARATHSHILFPSEVNSSQCSLSHLQDQLTQSLKLSKKKKNTVKNLMHVEKLQRASNRQLLELSGCYFDEKKKFWIFLLVTYNISHSRYNLKLNSFQCQ